jgi:CRP-like cAMP-binding protein/small-conductance mechanosensitive channel
VTAPVSTRKNFAPPFVFALIVAVAIGVVLLSPSSSHAGGETGSRFMTQLGARWLLAVIAGGIVFVAFLINRYAPTRRRRIRRVLVLFGAYCLAFLVTLAFSALGLDHWAERLRLVADLLEAITIVNLFALAVFDLALPLIEFELVSLWSSIIVGAGNFIALITVLHEAGVNASSVITTSAVVTGVLALSLQATLGNILGGVALQADGSIHVGDWIQLENGRQGLVREIRWRHTVLETRDWDTIVVPNATLLSSSIIILGKRNGAAMQHRMWVYFNVDFRYSPSRVIDVVRDAMWAAPIERVAIDPKPSVICYDIAKDGRDSFAYYAVRYWLTDLAIDDPTNSIIRTRIYAALRRADIPLARPAMTILQTQEDSASDKERDERHRHQRLGVVDKVDLFSPLTPDERAFVAEHLRYAPFSAGELITKQGAIAHFLYIFTSGRAEVVTRAADGEDKVVAELASPGFFGEMGLMTGEPRFASVVAITDVECFRLDKEGFQKILEERPELAKDLAETLAKRRSELVAIRDHLDRDSHMALKMSEQARILEKIRSFFGLGGA